MDRRSWLWRKKSSEKSQGETDSSGSGSISSYSERFSDEQANLTHNTPPPEVVSKAALNDEESENIKCLTEKLSAALLNVNAKEELVKQHAKVAEEAVAGWEKAEREVSSLKLQFDATLKKNSALEDRVGHLDGALKECARQLRQAREEQDQTLEEAIAKRAREWQSSKAELETQLNELRAQLEAANGLRPKLEAAEKENASLRLELVALSNKLEVTTLERDLSVQAAEAASKQHLESIKKVAKLEAEHHRLKLLARKAAIESDQKSFAGSSACVDSLADCQSDYGESNLEQNDCENGPGRNSMACSSASVLMDDFLEMERLVRLPETRNGNADLEKKIEKLEDEKLELKMALNDSQGQLKDAKVRSSELEAQLGESRAQLRMSQGQLNATKIGLVRMRHQLFECQDQLRASHAKLKGMETELIELQTQLIESEDQLKTCQGQMEHARAELIEMNARLIAREDELKRSQGQQIEVQAQLTECQDKLNQSQGQRNDVEMKLVELHTELATANKQKEVLERELEAANTRREEAESQVKALESETKSLQAKIDSLADKERALSAESTAKRHSLEDELPQRKLEPKKLQAQQEKELAVVAGKLADCQKTIASLGRQLQSLATLDEFLAEADGSLDSCGETPIFCREGELGRLPSIDCK